MRTPSTSAWSRLARIRRRPRKRSPVVHRCRLRRSPHPSLQWRAGSRRRLKPMSLRAASHVDLWPCCRVRQGKRSKKPSRKAGRSLLATLASSRWTRTKQPGRAFQKQPVPAQRLALCSAVVWLQVVQSPVVRTTSNPLHLAPSPRPCRRRICRQSSWRFRLRMANRASG
ncbi:hypothetical protein D3C71_1574230 [compost metagenome]